MFRFLFNRKNAVQRGMKPAQRKALLLRLEQRLAVAHAQGNMALIEQLEAEFKHLKGES